MGGSKNTEDIFQGSGAGMFGSMCVMMIMNVIFLKAADFGFGVCTKRGCRPAWMLLIVGIARVAAR